MPRPTGPMPARIMLVDECIRPTDQADGHPFSGYVGKELGKMLAEVGIQLSSCYSTWAVKHMAAGGGEALFAKAKKDITPQHAPLGDKHVMKFVLDGLDNLKREIESCQPNVIVAMGNTALFLLTGKWGIMNWRGSTLPCTLPGLSYSPKVIPIYPPGRVLANMAWRPITVNDLKRVVKAAVKREDSPPDYSFVIRPEYHHAMAILETLYREVCRGPMPLSVDIETRSYHIACIGIAWNTREALCIPLMCVERAEGYWTLDEEVQLMWSLKRLITHPNAVILGQNFHYDAQYFFRYLKYAPNLVRDTMLGQHVLFNNMPKGLDFLSSMYCEYHTYWKSEGKEWTADMSEDQLWNYNCKDCVITLEVDQVIQKSITSMGMREVHDFQMDLFWPVLHSMIRGVSINAKLRAAFAMSLFEEIAQREQWLIDILGYPLNPKSAPQMQDLFYVQLKQKPFKDRKTGSVTCNDEALRKIAEREPLLLPLCQKISEIRSLGVFLSTFVNAPLDIDGKMRCSFNIGGTETYRFSSKKNAFGSGANLQNIPSGGEM